MTVEGPGPLPLANYFPKSGSKFWELILNPSPTCSLLAAHAMVLSDLNLNEWMVAFIKCFVYCCTPKALYNHVGGLSSNTTSVQHPLGWYDGCHRTTAPVRSPQTSYRWRGEKVIEPIKWGLLGGHDWQGPVEGIWPGHRDYTPTLCER